MNRNIVISVAGAIALMGAVWAEGLDRMVLQETHPAAYAPEKWNVAAREKYAAQRFGVFVHWGLYSNYAQGEWYLPRRREGLEYADERRSRRFGSVSGAGRRRETWERTERGPDGGIMRPKRGINETLARDL